MHSPGRTTPSPPMEYVMPSPDPVPSLFTFMYLRQDSNAVGQMRQASLGGRLCTIPQPAVACTAPRCVPLRHKQLQALLHVPQLWVVLVAPVHPQLRQVMPQLV